MSPQEQPIIPYPGVRVAPAPQVELHSPKGNISFDIKAEANDTRARQFACRLVLRNNTTYSIDVLAINVGLGSGVTREKSDNTSSLDLKEEYDQLRNDIRHLCRAMYIAYSDGFCREFSGRFLKAVRSEFSFRNFLMVPFYLFGFRLAANQMVLKIKRMDFPVASSQDARKTLRALTGKDPLLIAKIDRMRAIEQIDPNFLRPEYITQILPGECFEGVYILKAKRKLLSIASYAAAFEVKLAWEEPAVGGTAGRHIERIMSQSAFLNVTPSPVVLSIFAMVFSLLGAALYDIEKKRSGASAELIHSLLSPDFALNSFVAAVLALVLYNSIEMTDFKDKIGSISWRSAMFLGILCGLLSDKMLKAITSFVGG